MTVWFRRLRTSRSLFTLGTFLLLVLAEPVSSQQRPAALANAASETTPPGAPRGLKAVVKSANQVDLSWEAAADKAEVETYVVYGNSGAPVTTVRATHYSHVGLTPGAKYTYKVRARDATGNLSEASEAVVVTTAVAPKISSVQAKDVTTTSAVITWTTDVPASSQVILAGDLANLQPARRYPEPRDEKLVTEHAVTVGCLHPSAKYAAYVVSKDAAGNTAMSHKP